MTPQERAASLMPKRCPKLLLKMAVDAVCLVEAFPEGTPQHAQGKQRLAACQLLAKPIVL